MNLERVFGTQIFIVMQKVPGPLKGYVYRVNVVQTKVRTPYRYTKFYGLWYKLNVSAKFVAVLVPI